MTESGGWRHRLAQWLAPDARPLPGLAEDRLATRPMPAANAWPDNAVTLSYREIRQLVALHLDMLAATMGRTAPWEDARRSARAMRDGETPLLLAEVLDR